MDGQDGGQDAALCRGGATLNSAFFLPPFSWVPGKIMENRVNHEIILPQRPQRAQKLTDHGKPGKPTSPHEEGQPDLITAKYSKDANPRTFGGTNPDLLPHG
jgi:hypothetical protein